MRIRNINTKKTETENRDKIFNWFSRLYRHRNGRYFILGTETVPDKTESLWHHRRYRVGRYSSVMWWDSRATRKESHTNRAESLSQNMRRE